MPNMSFINDIFKKESLPKLKIAAIADIHDPDMSDQYIMQKMAEKAPDFVVLLGDIEPRTAEQAAKVFKHYPVLYILGNHDEWGQFEKFRDFADMDGRVTEISGVKIAGLSGSPRYNNETSRVMRTQEEANAVAARLRKADILITHASPYKTLADDIAFEGFQAISKYIKEFQPSLHLFGHHHGIRQFRIGKTEEICVYGFCMIETGRKMKISLIPTGKPAGLSDNPE